MTAMLTGLECGVDCVADTREILAAQSRSFDLIFLDARLLHRKHLAMLSLVEALRKFGPPHHDIRAAVITYSAKTSSDLAFADAHIRVPFVAEDVRRIVALYCGSALAGGGIKLGGDFVADDADDSFAGYLDRAALDRALVALRAELDAFAAVSDLQDRSHVARRAHAIISSARILGFPALARASQQFEQSVAQGEICDLTYEEFLTQIDRARHRIDHNVPTRIPDCVSALVTG
ncbi:Hpt domain-containing protein [Beijerinckia sp. L45]|uniref:Hpt domain-containing protein n=1 Tax=Beijerinckia sp. L45 TaxID=1641855 RepID=UPI00131E18D7|nr:Hpt domain-containing protein [Beijerinckia sp. L45]